MLGDKATENHRKKNTSITSMQIPQSDDDFNCHAQKINLITFYYTRH